MMSQVFFSCLTAAFFVGSTAWAQSFAGFQGTYAGQVTLFSSDGAISVTGNEGSHVEFSHPRPGAAFIREKTHWRVKECQAWADEKTTIEDKANSLFLVHKVVDLDWCDGKGQRTLSQEGIGYCREQTCHLVYPTSTNRPGYLSEDNYRLLENGSMETFGMHRDIERDKLGRYEGNLTKVE